MRPATAEEVGAMQRRAVTLSTVRKATDAEIQEWADRHDLQGNLIELRCIFEDAESHHLMRHADGVPAVRGEGQGAKGTAGE